MEGRFRAAAGMRCRRSASLPARSFRRRLRCSASTAAYCTGCYRVSRLLVSNLPYATRISEARCQPWLGERRQSCYGCTGA
ncbi:hypothetical protein EJB05_30503 [Eragrostis curvula]|uniref:Uncharacterized protein n=2 Tax=Eragrostis curvula TaxID=38414 RepID=A0A5J9UCE7_9POAL|nr:hypothetical protein EJB05_30503 [Eragrostis curvula]